jgi:DNA-binding SARP family transcriptional activator
MRRTSTPHAKVARPILNGVVNRKRLFDQLDHWRERRLVWVCGPAGCGKTTLVGSYLQAGYGSVLWYQVDGEDRDPATLFYFVGVAAKSATPRHRKPLPLLTPEYLGDVPTFTRRYFEALGGRFRAPAAIVFDNLQEVGDTPGFYELLREGLSRLPRNFTTFLISRNGPPPAFARWLANREMAVLGWEELRLTAEESADLLRLATGAPSTEDDLHQLHRIADGWIAGLLLLAQWAKHEKVEPKALQRTTPEYLLDYFATEVFAHLDPPTQEFLLKTALLPRMTTKMAATLTGLPAGGAFLSRLNGQNIFTERRFRREPVYQYHPLFREFLLSRGREVFRPEELSALRRWAAALLEEEGETEQAAALLCEASEWEYLVALILQHAPTLLAQGRSRPLADWLDRLPAALLDATPWLLYWRGACLIPSDPASARLVYERAFNAFVAHADVAGTLLSWAGVVEAICYGHEDCTLLARWIGALDEMMDGLSRFPSPEIEGRVAAAMVTALAWSDPCRSDFENWAARALSHRTPTAFLAHLQTVWAVMRRDYFAGASEKFAQAREQLLELASSQDCPPLVHLMLSISEARYFDQAGQHEQCVKIALRGLEIAKREGIRILDDELWANAIIGALNMNDWKRARGWLEEMRLCHVARKSRVAPLHHWLKTREALISREIPDALHYSAHVLKEISLFPAIFLSWGLLLRARALHAAGRHEEAAECLAHAHREGVKLASPLVEFHLLMAEAEFQLDRGYQAEGLATLRKALRLGKAGGYLNIEVDIPSATARLCARALEAGIEVEYARTLIRKRGLVPEEPPYHLESWPWPLTVHTLGTFRLDKDGEPLSFAGKVQRKPLLLLKALIALGGKEIREEQVSDLLWPEADGDAGHSAFTTTLSRLRELLGVEHAIKVQDGRVTLDPRLCWVDAWAFERMVTAIQAQLGEWRTTRKRVNRGTQTDLPSMIGRAMDLYRGHFLSEEAAEIWTVSARERLRTKFLRLLLDWGEHLESAERWKDAVAIYHRGLEVDELAEAFYQRLLICYRSLGLRAEAATIYRRCEAALIAGLGVRPSSKTEALYRALRA